MNMLAKDVIMDNPEISYENTLGNKVYGKIESVESVNVLPVSSATKEGNPLTKKEINYLKKKSEYFQKKTLSEAYYVVKRFSCDGGFDYLALDDPSITPK